MSHSFPRTIAAIEQGIAEALHLGAQLYVSLGGRTLIDQAFGLSRPATPMSVETINIWMSSGKPVTAVAVMQMRQRGLLGLDDPITKFIPEFGQKGKDAITIRHLLTHTGGFRLVIGLNWRDPMDVAIAKICRAGVEPKWIIGK